jgi:hypothetical protein
VVVAAGVDTVVNADGVGAVVGDGPIDLGVVLVSEVSLSLLHAVAVSSSAPGSVSRNVRMPGARSVAWGEQEGVDLAVDDAESGDLAASVDAVGRDQLPAGGR